MNHIAIKLVVIAGVLTILSEGVSAQNPPPPDRPSRLRFMLTGSAFKGHKATRCTQCGQIVGSPACQCTVMPEHLSFWRNADFLFNSGVYGRQGFEGQQAVQQELAHQQQAQHQAVQQQLSQQQLAQRPAEYRLPGQYPVFPYQAASPQTAYHQPAQQLPPTSPHDGHGTAFYPQGYRDHQPGMFPQYHTPYHAPPVPEPTNHVRQRLASIDTAKEEDLGNLSEKEQKRRRFEREFHRRKEIEKEQSEYETEMIRHHAAHLAYSHPRHVAPCSPYETSGIYSMGYGVESMGDAFGPGMNNRVTGSGSIRYTAKAEWDGTYDSNGYRNFDLTDLKGPDGSPVGRSDAYRGGTFSWKVSAGDAGIVNTIGYPDGPTEWFTNPTGDAATGTFLKDIVAMYVPSDVSLDADNSRVFGNVYQVSAAGTIEDPRVKWNSKTENPVYLPEGTLYGKIVDNGDNGADNIVVFADPGEGYQPNEAQLYYDYVIPETVFVRNVLGRVKVSENMSPIPQTRFILDYNYFSQSPVTNSKANINRLTPGVEWAFLKNNRASFELRVPIGWTVNCAQTLDGVGKDDTGTVGDVTFYFKILLKRTQRFAMSAGMGISLPTSKPRSMSNSADLTRNFLEVKNTTVHLMPYLAVMYLPNDAFFMQGYAQVDIGAGRSDIMFYDYVNTNSMRKFGTWDECTYAYLSGIVGRWLYRDFGKRRGINGVNVSAELHYTQSLGKAKDISGSFTSLDGKSSERITIARRSTEEYLNLTFASHFLINRKNNLGFGFCVPIFNQKQFECEARITLNRYF